MTTHIDFVPKWLRIIVGILALLNIAFGLLSYFDISVLFPNGNSIDLKSALIKNASFEFAARNLAIGLALMLVALKGVPESITIVTIIRALIEIQTIIIAIVQGNITTMLVLPAVLLIIEIFIILTLIKAIAKRNV